MSERKKTTPQEERFCLEYSKHGNATKAMLAAYPARSKWKEANQCTAASRLLIRPVVQSRLEELKAENAAASLISREEVLGILGKIIRGEVVTDKEITTVTGDNETSQTHTVAVSWAIDRLIKLCGYEQPQKHELTGKDGSPLNPEPTIIEIIDRTEQVRREE